MKIRDFPAVVLIGVPGAITWLFWLFWGMPIGYILSKLLYRDEHCVRNWFSFQIGPSYFSGKWGPMWPYSGNEPEGRYGLDGEYIPPDPVVKRVDIDRATIAWRKTWWPVMNMRGDESFPMWEE